MALRLLTAPTEEPVTLAEAKAHLRIDTTDEDTLISSLITAARQLAETITRRQLITATWELVLDGWPDGDTAKWQPDGNAIQIPLPPLQSVASIKYKDPTGTETTVAASDYIVDTASEPARIVPAYGKSWPSATLYPIGAITIRFTAGYGAAAAVPAAIKAAMLLHIGHLFENREAVNIGNTVNELPLAYGALLGPYRVITFA